MARTTQPAKIMIDKGRVLSALADNRPHSGPDLVFLTGLLGDEIAEAIALGVKLGQIERTPRGWRLTGLRRERGFPGERILAIREFVGLTQMDLADRAGIHQSTISQIETGSRPGSLKSLTAIADALGCPLYDVLP